HGIKATFFMVGENAERHPELLKEVASRGHIIGNHTMRHLNGTKVATHTYLHDAVRASELLSTRLFRPPHGWLRPKQARALARGMRIVMYDLVTRDYSRRLTWQDVFKNVKRYARPGSIIVFHDSMKSWPRLEKALPLSLQWLKDQGYEFGTLENVKQPVKHHPNGEKPRGIEETTGEIEIA
ncbi:MAG: polysaccharide deacetylase family protein, partial [Muribaculaceae bacterium]|nr:polysaccharide deacetylase family protein [Muribaculaceae bacterium]